MGGGGESNQNVNAGHVKGFSTNVRRLLAKRQNGCINSVKCPDNRTDIFSQNITLEDSLKSYTILLTEEIIRPATEIGSGATVLYA